VRVFWVPPIGADRVGTVEVGEHQDVEQLGAGSGTSASRRSRHCFSSSSGRTVNQSYGVAGRRETAAGCLLGPSYTRPGAESDADAEAISTRPEGVS
jgi:hypothetical protein